MDESHAAGPVDTAAAQLRLPGAREETVELHRDREGHYVLPKGAHVTTSQQRARPVKPVTRRVKETIAFKGEGATSYGTAAVTERLVGLLGNNTVAELLGVAKDRPGRWIRGEGIDAVNRVALADLEALVGQLLAAFTPEQASLWLFGDNAHLGARPIDVFRLQGSGPVVDAIAAHEQGAFA
ncbi:hypothetical protein OF117_08675 [Geodermatophilus sp. YIM 151500]|uniref:hypothetical protein n=1 Tax=Geodermatophilus sp. YIM 151500 TaxID=2984531 RepID=UPI0021E4AC27|nr:hypothetical protein [Geodermatophilus sp. YIM 151500]MCV2489441.1 hypothetical protein [Geodermatophilus sp. YIM 151500]